ncbi:MAG: MarR family winged helix-turn-helix transcriptional regulator [Flavobacteriaceae bacterium]
MAKKVALIAESGAVARAAPDSIEEEIGKFRLQRAPGFLFRQMDARSTALFLASAVDPDITPRQFGLLMTLYQSGPMLQSDLGRAMCIDRSTLGEMLSRMLERGLVERRAWPQDRRVSQIAITDSGKDLFRTHFSAARRSQQELLAPLREDEREFFLNCLVRLTDAFSEER